MRDKKDIRENLNRYRNKYYKNKVLRGVLYTLLIVLVSFLTISTLDFTFRFGVIVRGILFFSFILLTLSFLIWRVINPLLMLVH